MIHNDYDSGYETLLTISGTSTMQISKRKQLAIEIFKTVNNLNPKFVKISLQVNKILQYAHTIYLSEVTIQQHTERNV